MISRNSSVINHALQKYANWIIRKVYKIPSHAVRLFNADLDSESSAKGNTFVENSFADGKFTFRSVLGGIPYRSIFLFKNYLKNNRQTILKKSYRINFGGETVVGHSGYSSSITIPGLTNHSIQVPQGYDGNLAFVKVMTGYLDADPDDNSGNHDSFITVLENALGASGKTNDLLLSLAPDLGDGQFSVEVAKSSKSIDISLNIAGVTGKADLEGYSCWVSVTYFKRGAK